MHMESKISTGTSSMDWLLEGGYENGVITTIYGPPGCGKTNLCLICLTHNFEKKIIYIDTEGSFSVSRIKQLTDNYEEILNNVIVLTPTDFAEQKKVFDKLKNILSSKIGLIIVDSIAMLYRLEIGITKDGQKVNRELGVQLVHLIQIARKLNIPVILTNQVYSDFEDKTKVNMVGGDVLRYASKCLIELQKTSKGKKAILRKHRSLPEGKEVFFKIVDEGLEELEE
ncbi:DNA repair and recombination protein RadB [Candidatus Woesearchaeota archaeon CG10_big_fil_rev_8_21_14_0_10_32_9]|nr:MAG: DNA repair and recombination protein RadB [Candidatus Woesearchaeota archaeon CG10_big_fil_rev_8_21_14_0_10_32_9]